MRQIYPLVKKKGNKNAPDVIPQPAGLMLQQHLSTYSHRGTLRLTTLCPGDGRQRAKDRVRGVQTESAQLALGGMVSFASPRGSQPTPGRPAAWKLLT